MAVRPVFNKELEARLNERLDKYLGRIYVLWLLGIFVGILKLKPEKYSISGVEFSISKPEALQGLIFLGCFALYLAMFAVLFAYGFQFSTSAMSIKRRMIYLALGKKRTFRGLNTRQILIVKSVARGVFIAVALFVLLVVLIPLIQILAFEYEAVWIAVKAITS